MASLFKRNNGIYTVAYLDGNRRRWHSTGLRDEAEAQVYFDSIKSSLEKRRPATLKELQDSVLEYARVNLRPGTVDLYKLAFEYLIRCVGNKQFCHLTPMDAERFKEYLINK